MHRADFERERERADKVVSELVTLNAKLVEAERNRSEMVAEVERARARVDEIRAEAERGATLLRATLESTEVRFQETQERLKGEIARAEAELTEWKTRPWWRRLVG